MMRQDRAEKVRETIEEELGSFVQFADLPATVQVGAMCYSNAAPADVDETWHLVRPADGSRNWAIAGIQQAA